MLNKTLGSIFVAAGTAIGAGMLALPLVSAGMGFAWAAVAFLGVWAVMLVSGLLTLEVTLAFKAPANHYATMARATLGRPGQWITMTAYMLLLYSLICAYISGGASMLEAISLLAFGVALPAWVNAVIFTSFLGLIVAWSTRALDYTNRGLFIFKLILLALVFGLFLPQINVNQLVAQDEARYVWAALPVVITAFGFHIVIPSLSYYLDENAKALKKVLIFGSVLPLIIYLIWLAALLGTLPLQGENSFASLAQSGGSVSELMLAINANQQSIWLSPALNVFAQIALITSFLGVSLGLFDFLRDKKDKQASRVRSGAFTFLPPLAIVLFYPNGFVQLLSYASIFVAIILIILPGLMAYSLRRSSTLRSSYRTPGGNLTIVSVVLIGFAFIVIECLRIAGCLPIWMGI
jgi:aromatic amino acid transport protein